MDVRGQQVRAGQIRGKKEGVPRHAPPLEASGGRHEAHQPRGRVQPHSTVVATATAGAVVVKPSTTQSRVEGGSERRNIVRRHSRLASEPTYVAFDPTLTPTSMHGAFW